MKNLENLQAGYIKEVGSIQSKNHGAVRLY